MFKDGRPAANINVRYVARTPDLKRNGITFIKTDANGHFSIDVYEGHAYMVGAVTDGRDANTPLEAKAAVIKINPGKNPDDLRLVLDQTGTDDDYSDFDIGNERMKN